MQPVRTQQGEGLRRQADRAVLIAFARANVQLHARTINLRNLERHAFQQPQATAVDHAQAGTRSAGTADLREHACHLVRAQHHRQLLWLGRADEVAEWPGTLEGVGKEKLQGIEGNVNSIGREVFDIAEIEEILADFFVGNQVRRLRVVDGELLDRSEVGLLGAGG